MILLLVSLSLAADVRVCAAGVEPPCHATIQAAIDAAEDGDRILVPVGVFEEAVVLRDRTLVIEGVRPTSADRTDLTGVGDEPPLRVLGGDVRLVGVGLRPRSTRALELDEGARLVAEGVDMIAGFGIFTDGGLIHARDSTLELSGCRLEGGRAIRNGGTLFASGGTVRIHRGERGEPSRIRGGVAGRAGGLIHADSLVVEDTELSEGHAELGGAIAVPVGGLARVVGEWTAMSDNEQHHARIDRNHATLGGAIHADAGATVALSELFVQDNTGGAFVLGDQVQLDARGLRISRTTGAVLFGLGEARAAEDGTLSRIRESVVCGSVAPGTLLSWDDLRISHSFVIGNEAAAIGAGGLSFQHSHLVDNAAARPLTRFSGTFEKNLVAHNALPSTAQLLGGAAVRQNLWWANETVDGRDGASIDGTALQVAPLLRERDEVDCDDWPAMYPSWYGGARGALIVGGRYDGLGLPMPGAWGGIREPLLYVPNGAPGVVASWEIFGDNDLDGVVNFYDCRYADPAIHPGAEDTPYDGIDSDCDGSDDFDVDGDGERAAEHGGTDCDDTDPERGSSREEIDGNGKDDDCNGWADAEEALVPEGCATAPTHPAVPAFVLAVLGLLTVRRRRAI